VAAARVRSLGSLAGGVVFLLWAQLAQAEVYTWVDADGVLHFAEVDGTKDDRYLAYSDSDVEGFGGQSPKVQILRDGSKRTLYAADVTRYDRILERAAEHYQLPAAFLKAVAKVESNFNPRAVSSANAKGLMQIIDGTARTLSVEDPFDPEQSIFGGARYLRTLANMFDGDLALTAAAYNAGPDRVKKAGGIPKIRETMRYVDRVLEMYRFYSRRR
jgi:soluble lytic murein transglycosylase-like protein